METSVGLKDPEPAVPISRKLVMINSASSVFTHVLNVSVLVWLQQYLLHRVSDDEYALFPIVNAPMVFVPLLTMILTAGLGRYVVEAYARKDTGRVTEIVSTMAPPLAGASALILACGGLLVWRIDHVLNILPGLVGDARLMLALLVLGAATRVLVSPFEVGLYVRQKFVLRNAILLATHLVRFGLLLSLLLGAGPRVLWVVVASVAADFLGLCLMVWISIRLVPALKFRPGRVRWSSAPELVSFGSWRFLQHAAGTVRRGVVPIILNRMATSTDVSCFFLGSLVFQQIQRLAMIAIQPLEPALVAMHTRNDRGALARVYLRGGRYGLWLATFLAAPLILYHREVVTLYVGEDKRLAGTVMMILLFVLPLQFGNLMMRRLASATARIKPLARWVMVHQLLNLLLTLVLVGGLGMGAMGAALGMLGVAVIMQPTVMWTMGRRLAGVKFSQWIRTAVWPGLFPAVMGTAVWGTMKVVVRPETWTALGLCILAGAVCFGGGVALFCLVGGDREIPRRCARVFGRRTKSAE